MKAKANLFRTLLVLPVVLLVAVAVALFGVGLRTAETQTTSSYYKVQALGTLPGQTYNVPFSTPFSINDFGHVVGEASFSGHSEVGGTAHAFLYKDGAMQDLGTLGGPSSSARSINASGQVVGDSDTDPDNWYGEPVHAFLYEDGQMKDLNTLMGLNSTANSYAYGINDFGHVVGCYDTASGERHAFLYKDGAMQDLGTLGGPSSCAGAINASGQVVGAASYDSSRHSHAFLYSSGAMQDLGTLGGTYSWASGINASGQVVGGGAYNSSGHYHAFLYRDEGPMQDLGVLASGENQLSWATDTNDFDQVVGYSDNDVVSSTSHNRAFLYQNEEMIDLGTRLHPDNNGNVWNLDEAHGINNEGQIVTEGWRIETNGTYTYSALLLTPTSDPPPDDSQAPSPPAIDSPANNTFTNDSTPEFSGTNSSDSTKVTIYDGQTELGEATIGSSGTNWSFTPTTALSEGPHSITAKAEDVAGNTTSASNSVTVTVDKTAPTVSSVSPARGATNVARNTSVTAEFSEKMDPATLTTSTVTLVKNGTTTPISATVSYDDATKIVTLKPSSNLAAKTKYTVKLSGGVKDLAGNALAPYTWSFTTGSW